MKKQMSDVEIKLLALPVSQWGVVDEIDVQRFPEHYHIGGLTRDCTLTQAAEWIEKIGKWKIKQQEYETRKAKREAKKTLVKEGLLENFETLAKSLGKGSKR